MKFFSNLISGIISSPFALGWLALIAIVFDAVYDKVVSPMAALYGYNLPDPPFWQWIVVGMLCNFITFVFRGTSTKKIEQDEAWGAMGKRFGVGALFFALSYLINWIWL